MENGTLKLNPFNEGKLMEGMFTYQKFLMAKYVIKGMLPTPPLNLNEREHQQFIRHTMGWIVEELVEAAKEVDEILELFATSVYTDPEIQEQLRGRLPKLTEELADVTHFFIELMFYSNIEADDMLGYYSSLLETNNLKKAYLTEDALTTSMMYARHLNINSNETREAIYYAYKLEQGIEENYAGSKISVELGVIIERVFWGITQKLFTAKNKLKMKDWKTSKVETNIQAYQELLMESWVAFTVLLDIMQLDAKWVYTHYENKTFTNQTRLNEGY